MHLASPLSNGLTSMFLLPQSILLPAACRYQARRSSRSGQPSFQGMCMRVLPLLIPFPPKQKIHTAQRTREGDLDLGSWYFGILHTCLPVLPASTACSTDPKPNMSPVLVCVHTSYWSHSRQCCFLPFISFILVPLPPLTEMKNLGSHDNAPAEPRTTSSFLTGMRHIHSTG